MEEASSVTSIRETGPRSFEREGAVMSDSASDIGKGLIVGFKNFHEFVKGSGANLFVFSFAGAKRKDNKSADGYDEDQYGNRCGVSNSSH